MLQFFLIALTATVLAGMAPGCARQRCWPCADPTDLSPGCPRAVDEPRRTAQIDMCTPVAHTLVSHTPVSNAWEPSNASEPTRVGADAGDLKEVVLEPLAVACRAAANAALANAMGTEGHARGCATIATKDREEASVQTTVYTYMAVDDRNRSASQALEAFYLLAEAEANHTLLRASLEKLDAMLGALDRVHGEGLRVEANSGKLRRERLALLERKVQLDLSVVQLNSQLRQSLGLEPDDTIRIRPVVEPVIVPEPLDYEQAVAEGLARRADVGLLSMLRRSLNEKTVDAVSFGISQVSGVPKAATFAACKLRFWLRGRQKNAEVNRRREQLDQLNADVQCAAIEEIRGAGHAVAAHFERIEIARLRVESWEQQVESLRLRRQNPAANVVALDISSAEMELLQARSQAIHEVTALRIAQVKLKESQGLLAFECGYRMPAAH